MRGDRLTQHGHARRRRIAQRIYLLRGFRQHLFPHIAREQSRIQLAGAQSCDIRRELHAIDGLYRGVVRFKEPGGDVVGPVRGTRQHQRPRIADDARTSAMQAFHNTVIGQFSYSGDNRGPIDAKPFCHGSLRGQSGTDRPYATGNLMTHVVHDLLGDRHIRRAIRLPVDNQRRYSCHTSPLPMLRAQTRNPHN